MCCFMLMMPYINFSPGCWIGDLEVVVVVVYVYGYIGVNRLEHDAGIWCSDVWLERSLHI